MPPHPALASARLLQLSEPSGVQRGARPGAWGHIQAHVPPALGVLSAWSAAHLRLGLPFSPLALGAALMSGLGHCAHGCEGSSLTPSSSFPQQPPTRPTAGRASCQGPLGPGTEPPKEPEAGGEQGRQASFSSLPQTSLLLHFVLSYNTAPASTLWPSRAPLRTPPPIACCGREPAARRTLPASSALPPPGRDPRPPAPSPLRWAEACQNASAIVPRLKTNSLTSPLGQGPSASAHRACPPSGPHPPASVSEVRTPQFPLPSGLPPARLFPASLSGDGSSFLQEACPSAFPRLGEGPSSKHEHSQCRCLGTGPSALQTSSLVQVTDFHQGPSTRGSSKHV